jgi:hypothetical protein
MDADTLKIITDLAQKHAWVALASFVIGLLVRLLKTDKATRLPVLGPYIAKIPKAQRPAVALLLGIVSGALNAVATGTLWRDALVGGLVSAAVAVFGHQWLVEGVRGGREVGKPKVPSDGILMFAIGAWYGTTLCGVWLVFSTLLSGCGAGAKACAVVDLAEQGCTVLRYLEPGGDGGVVTVPVTPEEVLSFGRTVSLKRSLDAGVNAPDAVKQDAGACTSCGGSR